MANGSLHWIASLLLAAGALPALAHHSFGSEFDESKPVTIEGVVTRVDWENPHVHYYVDVKQSDGSVVNWSCETGGPKRLERRGWMRDSLKPGDKVVVHAFPSKDGSHSADGRKVTLADGRTISSASRY